VIVSQFPGKIPHTGALGSRISDFHSEIMNSQGSTKTMYLKRSTPIRRRITISKGVHQVSDGV
jgi:hypothetical protein